MNHSKYPTVRLRQLHFRSAAKAAGCHAAFAVRAVQSATYSPNAALQLGFERPFGFDLLFPVHGSQNGLSDFDCRRGIRDQTVCRRVGLGVCCGQQKDSETYSMRFNLV